MKAKIKSFSVYGLFGSMDVAIDFEQPIKILIGENGLGKTQILNLFYYTLSRNFEKLLECNFESLALEFSSGVKVEIERGTMLEVLKSPIVLKFMDVMDFSEYADISEGYFRASQEERLKIERGLKMILRETDLKHNIIFLLEQVYPVTFDLVKAFSHISEELQKLQFMYFPTYRRVEEDAHKLGYEAENIQLPKTEQGRSLIQFGMADVQKRFGDLEGQIDRLLKEGLTQFTKDILNVVIDDNIPDTQSILAKINENDLAIILSRVGELLPEAQKQAIKEVVAKKQLKNPLSAYLLQKLVEIYEKQKTLDSSIKRFRDVCNRYLRGKQVFYDESDIRIYIKSDFTNEPIALKHLSSGEKQIISIFTKIYLSAEEQRFMVLFDEPELSLSILWQKQLLPDILNSNKCDFLLAVTHSPFIFDNELDQYAVGLNEYVRPSQKTIR